jgi:hypothetical protein
MPTLTKARVAQLCEELRAARSRAITSAGSEYNVEGTVRRLSGTEIALASLVADLAGIDAMKSVHAALDEPITADELAAYQARKAAQQASFAKRAAQQNSAVSA